MYTVKTFSKFLVTLLSRELRNVFRLIFKTNNNFIDSYLCNAELFEQLSQKSRVRVQEDLTYLDSLKSKLKSNHLLEEAIYMNIKSKHNVELIGMEHVSMYENL